MPCCPPKERPFTPLNYTWSKSWPCPPRDNLKSEHKCHKPEPKKNFDRLHREAIEATRKKFLERSQSSANMDGKASGEKQRVRKSAEMSPSGDNSSLSLICLYNEVNPVEATYTL